MTLLGSRPITRKTPPAGSFVNGVWSGDGPETWTESTFKGSLQPMTDRQIESLPQGQRERAKWKVYTYAELQTVEVVGKKRADRVVVQGVDYIVHGLQDHSESQQSAFGRALYGRCTNHRRYMLLKPEEV